MLKLVKKKRPRKCASMRDIRGVLEPGAGRTVCSRLRRGKDIKILLQKTPFINHLSAIFTAGHGQHDFID